MKAFATYLVVLTILCTFAMWSIVQFVATIGIPSNSISNVELEPMFAPLVGLCYVAILGVYLAGIATLILTHHIPL